MSDFDKEAEREKLREKYEQDQQKREATEKMSELLLQGATMTNAHCSECGDPVFRYDGQEFCATCEKPVDRGDGEHGDETDGQAGGIEVTEPSEDARVSFGGESASETEDPAQRDGTQASPDETGGGERDSEPTRSDQRGGGRQRRRDTQPRRQDDGSQPAPSRSSERPPQPVDGDIATARASLARTLARFSEQAETCEDPQQAREYLAAAREAAATLDELRR